MTAVVYEEEKEKKKKIIKWLFHEWLCKCFFFSASDD